MRTRHHHPSPAGAGMARAVVAVLAVIAAATTGVVVPTGAASAAPLGAPVVAVVAAPGTDGYWLATATGEVRAFGGAPALGSLGDGPLNRPIVGMAAAPGGGGYWLVASDGGIFSFGAAHFAGSTGAIRLNQPIVGMAADPDGSGYWLVARDGGIFSFDAAFRGSTGNSRLNQPIVGMAADPDGSGYWHVAADGGVFDFGTPFLGSAGGATLAGPIVGMAATGSGAGYWLAGADGTVLGFGDADPASNVGRPVLAVDVVVGGLTIPWDASLTPDGVLVWTERGGRLRTLAGGTTTTVGAPADVFAVGESGMLGLAVDPDFLANRRLYVCQAWTDGTRRDVRVHAWTLAPDARSATRLGPPLVSGITLTTGGHAGCRPEIGPDGALWVGTGDATEGATPQDGRSLAGKVLRVDRMTGAPAPGNPGGSLDARIFTLGHRNVQGLAFRPGSGAPYAVEHGPDRDDEITALRAGGNGGWAPGPGYDQRVPMTDLARFPDAMRPTWASGRPTVATSGAEFLSGPQWKGWDGALAVAFLKGSEVRLYFLDAAGALTSTETILTGRGRLRSLDQGTDGNLYVTTSNGSGQDEILRLTPR